MACSGGTLTTGRHRGVGLGVAVALAITLLGPVAPAAADPNSPPVAVPDSASVVSGQSITLQPLANDSDPDPGTVLSLVSVAVTTPASGAVTQTGNDVVVTPAAGFVGILQAVYVVSDGAATAEGGITVEVTAPPPPAPPPAPSEEPPPAPAPAAPPARNHRPVAVTDVASVQAGRTIRVAVLANDRDRDADRIRLDKVRKAKKGKARKAGSKIVYRAPASFSGTVRIRYRIRDARGARDWGTLTVTVTRKPKPAAVSKQSIERSLSRLGLPVGRVDGRYDSGTRRAVCAWRTITGRRAHRGLPSKAESRAIAALASLPKARSVMVDGVTVSVTCQAAFWVGSQRTYKRVMPVSTGMAGYRTRRGTFRVFLAHRTWRYSTIYPEARMYKPMQFSGGQALHGSATDLLVKTYPASHGCVRMLHRDVDALQAAGFGTGSLVRVIGRW